MHRCLTLSFLMVVFGHGLSGADEAGLAAKVTDRNGFQEVVQCKGDRLELARCLIDQLEVVPFPWIASAEQEIHPHEMRTIWSLRALRRLTGLDFVATCACVDHDSPPSAWFTGQDDPFFHVWMSRDTVYLAPPCVQQAIIDQWRTWIETPGQLVSVPTAMSINDWYF